LKAKYTKEFYKELFTYNINDVEIQKSVMDKLAENITELLEKNRGKKFSRQLSIYRKNTRAGLGLYILKNLLGDKEFKENFPSFDNPKLDQVRKFVEKCYHGALVDSWNEQKLDDVLTYNYDIVSHYPNIMRNFALPFGIGK
jgi:hypothetical protein